MKTIVEGAAKNILNLLECALDLAQATTERRTQHENFCTLEKLLSNSTNIKIAKNLKQDTIEKSIYHKASKACKEGRKDERLKFWSIYLDSISQFVHGKDYEEVYEKVDPISTDPEQQISNSNSALRQKAEIKMRINTVSANTRTFDLSNYWYNKSTVNALRLVGAADEYYLKEVVHINFDSTQYSLPNEMNKEYDRCLAIISEESKKRGSQFFDGPCVRLINIWESSIDASEEKHLHVTLGPINWFSFSVVDQLIHEETLAGTYNSFVEKYANLDAIRRNNFKNNVLPNIIETVTTIVTNDGYLIYASRNAVSTVAGMYSATVSENIHRGKDVDVYNGSIPDPFKTVIRGIKEELSPSISENLGSDNVRLLGLCYNLDELHPTFLFLVEAPYSIEDFFSICRNKPGRDFKESVYHISKIEALSDNWDEIFSSGKWYASGKASILRSLEFLKYKHN